jgi:hypothetical protein
MKSLSLLFEDGFDPQGFIFYIPLLELFSRKEENEDFLKQCFARLTIPRIEIFSRTNLYTT